MFSRQASIRENLSSRKWADADGYQLMVSFDTVLGQALSQANHLVKLDTDKSLWNQYEVCSTITQLESKLDQRKDATQPVLFYAQPMNVHQFARNTGADGADPELADAGRNGAAHFV